MTSAAHERKATERRGEALRGADWVACSLLLVLLTGIYLWNGDVLPGNDVKASVYLPLSVMDEGRLSFRPSQVPFMFLWEISSQPELGPTGLNRWDVKIGDARVADLYSAGTLRVAREKYFLTPTNRTDAKTGERLYVNTFGPGAALAALPVFAVIREFVDDPAAEPWYLWYGGKVAASLFVAASAVFVMLTARRFLPLGPSALLALAYGLGTSVWSVSSQTLLQHGPNEFFLAAGTYFLLDPRRRFWAAVLCGVAYSAAVLCRPTSIVFALCGFAYFLWVDRRALLGFAAGALPLLLCLGAYNAHYLGSPFKFGQTEAGAQIAREKTGSDAVFQTPLLTGLAGTLVSPSRGLFVFSPFLLLALAGAYGCWRGNEWSALRPLVVAVVLMVIIESKHYDWWGGWSWSYRKVVDTTPALAVLMIPVLPAVLRSGWKASVMIILLAWSVFVQFVGAFAFDLVGWNNRLAAYELQQAGQEQTVVTSDLPWAERQAQSGQARVVNALRLNVDDPKNRQRLWSLTDNQILYYLTHFAESRAAKKEIVKMFIDNPAA